MVFLMMENNAGHFGIIHLKSTSQKNFNDAAALANHIKIKPQPIRPSLYNKITPKEKYMMRMRALAHDSVPETKAYNAYL